MPTREELFTRAHDVEFEYLGYSQIQVRTERMSDIDAFEVDLTGQVSTNIRLRNPILTAAMNSISEADMGIAMGLSGGGAIIHHCNTPEEQKRMVRTVKTHLNGIIDEPVVAREDATIEQTLELLERADHDFNTLPVVDENGRCVGLMNSTSFKLFSKDPSNTLVRDAMHVFGSFAVGASDLAPGQVFDRMKEEKASTLLLLDADRRVEGLCLLSGILREVDSNPSQYSLDKNGRLITFASVPTIPEEALERLSLMGQYLDVVGIDTSHGEHKYAVETLKIIKENYPNIDVLAGNISTEQTAIQIARMEPDGMVVGQGPGGICISSDRLGFGTPQASAIYEVSKGVRSVNPDIPIIADGGISEPADTMKAFALGATAVKVGGLVAGTKETPVPVITGPNGERYKEYWGMGSERAQRAFSAARARYGHYGAPRKLIFIEGFEKKIPLKGSVSDVIEEHVFGTKISMAAQGARDIGDLYEHASFMKGKN